MNTYISYFKHVVVQESFRRLHESALRQVAKARGHCPLLTITGR